MNVNKDPPQVYNKIDLPADEVRIALLLIRQGLEVLCDLEPHNCGRGVRIVLG